MTAELHRLALHELSTLIGKRDLSPVEVTKAFLAQCEEANGLVNAIATLDGEGALKQAQVAEQEIGRGIVRGPLHGIPIAHKDVLYTRGLRTTAGSKILEDFVPDSDADVVAQLREAGCVVLGKLNTQEFAYGTTNEQSVFGPVRNPWDFDRFSGGSSGGSAAAVAMGMCAGATGSDTGGSIRRPAACCGVTGLKATYDLISRRGLIPMCWTMDHVGPIAKSVRDVALLLDAMVRPEGDRPNTASAAFRKHATRLSEEFRGCRIGVPHRYFYDQSDEMVERVVLAAVQTLRDAGCEAREIDIPHVEYSAPAAALIYYAEASAAHDENFAERMQAYSDRVRLYLEGGQLVLAKDYIRAQRFRSLLAQEFDKIFASVDAVITPTLPITAGHFGQEWVTIRGKSENIFGALLRNVEPFNLTGLPALTVPCGFSKDGLPIGMQIIARPYHEMAVLNLGYAYQRLTDWHRVGRHASGIGKVVH